MKSSGVDMMKEKRRVKIIRDYNKIIKVAMIMLFLAVCGAAAMCFVVKADDVYVNSYEGLRLRAEPNEESEILSTLSFGTKLKTKLKTFGENDEWMRVRYDGQKGYVHTDYVQEDDPLEGMTLLGTWHITAYTHTGNVCANGNYPTTGYTIACNSLDFGTKVYISGVGIRVVEDRGPTWLGTEWADVFMSDYGSCVAWGSQYREVYLVEE